jgi:hypothetical protein
MSEFLFEIFLLFVLIIGFPFLVISRLAGMPDIDPSTSQLLTIAIFGKEIERQIVNREERKSILEEYQSATQAFLAQSYRQAFANWKRLRGRFPNSIAVLNNLACTGLRFADSERDLSTRKHMLEMAQTRIISAERLFQTQSSNFSFSEQNKVRHVLFRNRALIDKALTNIQ